MKAKEIMTEHVLMVEEDITVAEAVGKMIENKVSSLVVNRKYVDDAYGIMTRRDVVNKVLAQGKDPTKIKVADIMTKPVVTVTPNLNIRYVAQLMAKAGVRRLPVFDGHAMLGLISNSDLFRSFAQHLTKEEK